MRKFFNQAIVKGTLKTIEAKEKDTYEGKTIFITVIVESKIEGKTNYAKVFFYAKESYPYYEQYRNFRQLKTIDKDGRDNADRVRIKGDLSMSEETTFNEYKASNSIWGDTMYKISDYDVDECGAEVECIIADYEDEILENGRLTGRKKVSLLTVAYNNKISELQNVYVEKELAYKFDQLYAKKDVALLYLRINGYQIVDEQKYKTDSGFGCRIQYGCSNISYLSDISIIGGEKAKENSGIEVEEIIRKRELKKQETMKNVNQDSYRQFSFEFCDFSDENRGVFSA